MEKDFMKGTYLTKKKKRLIERGRIFMCVFGGRSIWIYVQLDRGVFFMIFQDYYSLCFQGVDQNFLAMTSSLTSLTFRIKFRILTVSYMAWLLPVFPSSSAIHPLQIHSVFQQFQDACFPTSLLKKKTKKTGKS